MVSNRRARSEAQETMLTLFGGDQGLVCLGEQVEYASRVRKQRFPSRRQMSTALADLEQRCTVIRFQRTNMRADRRLRQVQQPPRTGEAAFAPPRGTCAGSTVRTRRAGLRQRLDPVPRPCHPLSTGGSDTAGSRTLNV